MTNEEFDDALSVLIAKGLIRIVGTDPEGDPIFENVPDRELSDAAKAYAAYLDMVEGKAAS